MCSSVVWKEEVGCSLINCKLMVPSERSTCSRGFGNGRFVQEPQKDPEAWFDLKVNTHVYIAGLPEDATMEEVCSYCLFCRIFEFVVMTAPIISCTISSYLSTFIFILTFSLYLLCSRYQRTKLSNRLSSFKSMFALVFLYSLLL